MHGKWSYLLVGIVVALTGAYFGGHFANSRSQEYFYAQIRHGKYPKRSFYIKIKDDFETEHVWFEIPFGLHSIAWRRLNQHFEMRIEFTEGFDLSSPDSRRYGYTLEIVDRKRRLILWYGHNIGVSTVGELGVDEVALVDTDNKVVVARGRIHFEGRTAWIEIQAPEFTPEAVYLFYTPSREAFEEGALKRNLASLWVAKRYPWGHRISPLSGKFFWRETEATPVKNTPHDP